MASEPKNFVLGDIVELSEREEKFRNEMGFKILSYKEFFPNQFHRLLALVLRDCRELAILITDEASKQNLVESRGKFLQSRLNTVFEFVLRKRGIECPTDLAIDHLYASIYPIPKKTIELAEENSKLKKEIVEKKKSLSEMERIRLDNVRLNARIADAEATIVLQTKKMQDLLNEAVIAPEIRPRSSSDSVTPKQLANKKRKMRTPPGQTGDAVEAMNYKDYLKKEVELENAQKNLQDAISKLKTTEDELRTTKKDLFEKSVECAKWQGKAEGLMLTGCKLLIDKISQNEETETQDKPLISLSDESPNVNTQAPADISHVITPATAEDYIQEYPRIGKGSFTEAVKKRQVTLKEGLKKARVANETGDSSRPSNFKTKLRQKSQSEWARREKYWVIDQKPKCQATPEEVNMQGETAALTLPQHSSAHIITILRKNKCTSRLPIKRLQPISGGRVLMTLYNETDFADVRKKIEEVKDPLLSVRDFKKLNPRICLYGLHKDSDPESIAEDLVALNCGCGEEWSKEAIKYCYHRKVQGSKNDDLVFIYEVSPKIYIKVLEQRRVRLAYQTARIYPHTNVLQCYTCWNYGHLSKNCTLKREEGICGRCAGKHNSRECMVEPSHYKCVNCERFNRSNPKAKPRNTNHVAFADTCEEKSRAVMQAEKFIDYGY